MRYHSLRFDIWVCLGLSVLIAMGVEKIASPILAKKYEDHKEEHQVVDDAVGGIATDEIYRAQSVEDLLSHDTFTIVSPGIEFRNKGAGYYHGAYMYAVTLPSGEIIAARINNDSVVSSGDSIFSGDNTLPVGRIVEADLNDDSYFLGQIEHSLKLSRKDFYIDMLGEAEIKSEDEFIGFPIMMMQAAVVVLFFPIFHTIGSKFGIFPYFFAPKKKKEEKWD